MFRHSLTKFIAISWCAIYSRKGNFTPIHWKSLMDLIKFCRRIKKLYGKESVGAVGVKGSLSL